MMPQAKAVTVGLSISARSVCAVALRAGRIVWSREVARSEEQQLEDSLTELLGALPKSGLMRPQLYASVGPHSAQVRNVGEHGWARDRQLARSIVSETPGRFFLVNGTPVLTTDVQPSPDGGTLVGAIDRPVVDAISLACTRLQLRFVLVTPAAAVLGYAIEEGRVVLEDGDLSLMATYAGGQLASCRRLRSAEMPAPQSGETALHRDLCAADEAERFTVAYGAARAGRSVQLALRQQREASGSERRVLIAASTCALAAAFALVVPPVVAAHRASGARTSRATIARSGERALDAERRLVDAASTLRELHAFARGRQSATLVLASLSEAIEHPTMLLSLQADTLGGTLVALTPRASTLMAMLDSVPQIADSRIVGPVTLQARTTPPPAMSAQPGLAPRQEAAPPMERVTVRFAWSDLAAAPAARKIDR